MSDSKIRKTTDPVFGAKCAVHGGSADGVTNFYDLGSFKEFWGAVVLCENCAKELLLVMDYVPVAEVENRNEQIKNLHERVQEVEAENGQLRSALNAFDSVRSILGTPNVAAQSGSEDAEGIVEFPEESEPGTSKSGSSRRSKVVSSATDDGPDFS